MFLVYPSGLLEKYPYITLLLIIILRPGTHGEISLNVCLNAILGLLINIIQISFIHFALTNSRVHPDGVVVFCSLFRDHNAHQL
jgi:hypothetical protein